MSKEKRKHSIGAGLAEEEEKEKMSKNNMIFKRSRRVTGPSPMRCTNNSD